MCLCARGETRQLRREKRISGNIWLDSAPYLASITHFSHRIKPGDEKVEIYFVLLGINTTMMSQLRSTIEQNKITARERRRMCSVNSESKSSAE